MSKEKTPKKELDRILNKSRNIKIALTVLLCIVVVLMIAIYFIYMSNNNIKEDNMIVKREKVTQSQENKVEDKKVGDTEFCATMNTKWYFKDANTASEDAYVENSKVNNNPIKFDVYIADTNQVIYTSPVLQVGQGLKRIKLDAELEKGKYKCICKYSILDNDEKTVVKEASFEVNIVINN